MPLLCWIFTMLTMVCTTGAAEDWNRFRGPGGRGESEATGIPVRWTDADYRWKIALPGVGDSSPIVVGERLFVTSATEDPPALTLYCLRTTDGGILWKHAVAFKPYSKHKLNGYASSTPTADDRAVYWLWAAPENLTAAAFDQADGRPLWRRDLGPFASQHGFGASPVLCDDLLLVPNDQDGASSLIALDRATGKTRWIAPRRTEKTAFSTPLVLPGERPQVVTSSWAHGVSGLDPKTGKTLWELPVFQNRTVGSPSPAGGLIFASAGEGGVGKQMVAVRPGDPAQGIEAKVAYTITGPLPYVCTPVARGNLVFLWHDKGIVSCLDAPTGKVHWRERIGGDYFASPIRIADRLYCPSRTGEMVVLAASEKYELLARFPLGEATNSTPAVADGKLYLRTVGHVMAVK